MPTLTMVSYPRTLVNGRVSRGTLDAPPVGLGVTIRRLRKDREIPQSEMARRVGVSRQVYASYERGAVRISADRLGQIASELGMAASDILRESEGAAAPQAPATPAPVQRTRTKLPPRAYERVYGYLEKMRAAGLNDEDMEIGERLMVDPLYSKLNKRDIRDRNEDDLIIDIDAAWAYLRILMRERGL